MRGMSIGCVLLSVIISAGAWGAIGEMPIIPRIPRITDAPKIDGKFDDPCWSNAVVWKDFSLPGKKDAPAKAAQAMACFDEQALYLAVRCAEPDPAKIRAKITTRGGQVWTDDCIEIWIRSGGSQSDLDQFIVNSIGTQEEHRQRGSKTGDAPAKWQVATTTTADAWQAEYRISAADLGLDKLQRGDVLEIKIGREDFTLPQSVASVWPAGVPYSPLEGYAAVALGNANLLASPDFVDLKPWGVPPETQKLMKAGKDGTAPTLGIDTPAGQGWRLDQYLKLRPNSRYRLSADVRSPNGITMRIRTRSDGATSDQRTDQRVPASKDYQHQSMMFSTASDGQISVSLWADASKEAASYAVRDLALIRVPAGEPMTFGPAVPVHAGADPLLIQKLRVTDARVMRGFVGAPVDGTVRSGGWDGVVWEYPQPHSNSGVVYAYRNNDGFHATFAADLGFNAVVVRGGIKAKLVADASQYDDPASGKLITSFPGQAQESRAYFEQPVKAKTISFFDVSDGALADCSFFRVQPAPANVKPGLTMTAVAQGRAPVPTPLIARYLALRFRSDERTIYRLDGSDTPYKPDMIKPPAGKAVHLIAEPFTQEHALGAIGLDFTVQGQSADLPFTVRIQDPLNPHLELHGADYTLDTAGRARIVCDFADQIVPAGRALWVTLRFEQPVTLADVQVQLYIMPRQQALPEALEYRKFLLKSFYSPISEARPWNGFSRQDDIDRYLAQGREEGGDRGIYNLLRPYVAEILDTLDQCRALDPDGKDPIVRQYYQWIYRSILRRSPEGMPPFPTQFAKIDGVPEWAALLHQAWMQARAVPKWWIDNREVATGEFGGEVGDDSDMYQNYAPFPFFERDGVAGELLDAGARIAALAEKQNLENGLNINATDPLHAYEEAINHLALMAYWNYGDPVYLERCMVNAANTEKALTVKTGKGHRHFKNETCGAIDLKMNREVTGEDGSHFLMWHPALVAGLYNHNPRIIQMLREWGDGWMEHQQPGQYASGVALPADVSKSTSANQPFPGLYGFAGSMFVGIADLTGDAKYVKPYLDFWAQGNSEAGSNLHAPELLQMGMATPDKTAVALKGRWNAALYQGGDKTEFVDAIRKDIEELQRFQHMYTTVECFTDRVFLYPAINPAIAYTGGYTTRNKLNLNYAVSWDGFGTEYAALVTSATASHLKVLLCNVSDKPIKGQAAIWRLAHGEYEMTFGPDANGDDQIDKTEIQVKREIRRGDRLDLALPAKTVYVLELKQTAELDDLSTRPDLAISPLDLKRDGGRISAKVHNIGGGDAAQVVVALVDANGKEVKRQTLPALAAPLDLVPKMVDFTFDGVPETAAGWSIVIDPDQQVPEIYEGNNRLIIAK